MFLNILNITWANFLFLWWWWHLLICSFTFIFSRLNVIVTDVCCHLSKWNSAVVVISKWYWPNARISWKRRGKGNNRKNGARGIDKGGCHTYLMMFNKCNSHTGPLSTRKLNFLYLAKLSIFPFLSFTLFCSVFYTFKKILSL